MSKQKKMNKEEKEMCLQFIQGLKQFKQNGTPITMEGKPMDLAQIATICAVKERGQYMGDYINDDSGKIVEIRFDRVSKPK